MKTKLAVLIALFFLSVSCDNEIAPEIPPEKSNGYLVINEGLYGQNNASLTFYDLKSNEATQNVYFSANGGNDLGDTANDFMQCCGKGFIVLDKSKKIEIIDLSDFKSLGFIDFNEYGSPRNIAFYDTARAYVTTLENLVVEINPNRNRVTRTIQVGVLPEGITICDGKIFVANSGFGTGNSVSVIDLYNWTTAAEIEVGKNPRFMESDDEFVYAISAGDYVPPGEGSITKISASTLVPVDTILLNGNPGKACIAENNLYVIYAAGIAKINLSTFSITDSLFISGAEVNSLTGVIYSIFFDEDRSRFLVGNPKDFLQNGEVVIFSNEGEKTGSFSCGLNPGKIAFISNN
jgi:hypothetical protein